MLYSVACCAQDHEVRLVTLALPASPDLQVRLVTLVVLAWLELLDSQACLETVPQEYVEALDVREPWDILAIPVSSVGDITCMY